MVRPPGRSEITALLEANGLRPSRALGQNFLTDPNIADKIVRLAALGPGDRVVEIGAGLGSLTVALASSGAKVTAIEIDKHLLPLLTQAVGPLGVEVVAGDAMSLDWRALLGSAEAVVVANLPYNIATPLVLDLLQGVGQISRMLVMVQREVADRLAAAPRSAAFGAVSVRLSYFATARVVGRVPPSVFVPRPKVESALVEITRRPLVAVPPSEASYEEINRLVALGFSVRRKMLRRSLVSVIDEAGISKAGIDPASRPEELAIDDWGRLAAVVRERSSER